MGRALGLEDLQVYAGVLCRRDGDSDLNADFERLAEDADERTRADLARRVVAEVRALLADHPGVLDLGADAPKGTQHYVRTMNRALADLDNPAQVDVLRRLRPLRAREH